MCARVERAEDRRADTSGMNIYPLPKCTKQLQAFTMQAKPEKPATSGSRQSKQMRASMQWRVQTSHNRSRAPMTGPFASDQHFANCRPARSPCGSSVENEPSLVEGPNMEKYNLLCAWIGVLLGLLSGALVGLAFHKEDFLGGYNSWTRRLLRLGHISFFGISFLNFAFVETVGYLRLQQSDLYWRSILFIVAQITMPTVCILAAFKKPLRQLFFIPVVSTIAAAGIFTYVLKGAIR